MSRTLVVGDIHGGYKGLIQLFERANVTTADQLIFLGDYVDGWSEPDKVVDFLLQLEQTHSCIFLRGNHESLLTQWMLTRQENPQWFKNGGDSSVKAYKQLTAEKLELHLAFFQRLQNYYIDQENRLFVHAGFTNPRGIEAEFFEEYLYWDRTLWEMVMAMDPNLDKDHPLYPRRLQFHNEIFIGHTPVTHFGFDVPVNFANVWNIDTGAAFFGKISLMDVDTKAYWQSDRLADLYPMEEGRNHK
ncbi:MULTISPECIES: metallophosphoesterase family protein [unclassified Myroides]|uniref:metallophosphoesterase family protein n=1 Tax=unclassified Myroides TaxID=2642485 RepID=UPI0015FA317B|nr:MULTISPECIES: metallophosphoesterase family protein [unclassified Myroides]MBB1150939.1 serine/threonine protein phosphatase [Myroides sp. NP-2]MDM1406829.1 serine/threonine protein phosphatase [Myroides sp. DF42-4-2]